MCIYLALQDGKLTCVNAIINPKPGDRKNGQKKIEAFARKAAKGIKTENGLNNLSPLLAKITIEAALNAAVSRRNDRWFLMIPRINIYCVRVTTPTAALTK